MMKHTFNIQKTAEELVPDSLNRTGYSVAAGLTTLMAGGLAVVWSKLPRMVPLWLTEPWGEARLAPKIALLVLPGLAMLTIGLNVILGQAAGKLSPIMPRVLSAGAAVVAITLLIALYGIVQSLSL